MSVPYPGPCVFPRPRENSAFAYIFLFTFRPLGTCPPKKCGRLGCGFWKKKEWKDGEENNGKRTAKREPLIANGEEN
ncbi:MAG: hypothetical protein C6P37_03980 [Caldibacillus debilis]|uniref:Uncharacterized protein n=1 Tax=Caldibacillus debilis TaxID=301148 RepID=A0A3E0K705_9BACI|nr:hypothetical protein [Bacillaceae bacterium]MBY6272180.1 hypothetical protein [Bacillaceae bacterium]REJ19748.1 MAG: hypothetical protein C6W57_00900 [Caldibacillus debilis]REJ29959.1 MAG: hypothetical protein C6P37_03980 [Caldibacillus debilis]